MNAPQPSSEIRFSDICVSADGVITALVARSDFPDKAVLRIELPYSYTPADDLLATTLACMCGSKYRRIVMDLAIPDSCKQMIERFSGADVTVSSAPEIRRRPGRARALNFSGGLDSLAAWSLMPGCELISLDFGGRFSREEAFFRRFNPHTFRTNLVDIGLNRNHWSFMAIGSILLRDELDIGTYAFGEIMGAASSTHLDKPADQSKTNLPQGSYLGMSVFKPSAGLTEIGAIQLGLRRFGGLIPRALQSVALPPEEKYLRKYLMVTAVTREEGFSFELIEPEARPARAKWGDNYANDLSSMFIGKILGANAASATYVDGVPEAVLRFISASSLSFFTRVNPHAYGGLPKNDLPGIYQTLLDSAIEPYHLNDWKELAEAVRLLKGGG